MGKWISAYMDVWIRKRIEAGGNIIMVWINQTIDQSIDDSLNDWIHQMDSSHKV